MSYLEGTRSIRDIIPDLPRRVRVSEDVSGFPFVSGDILTLLMVKSIHLVQTEERRSGETNTIPLHYRGKVYRLGNLCKSVLDVKQQGNILFSVEEQFEIQVGPWKKEKVEGGSIVEVTGINHDKDVLVTVKHTEEPVMIKENTPLNFLAILEDENLTLEETIKRFGVPQTIVIEGLDKSSDKFLKFGNYTLKNVLIEDFILGYKENNKNGECQNNFVIPVSCDIRVTEEVPSPKIGKPYKNAFFVPKHIYKDSIISDLYFEYIAFKEKQLTSDECIPDVPPRMRLIKAGIHRQSLMSNHSDTSSGPTRPGRRRRTSSVSTCSSEIPRPYERLSSLEEDHDYKGLSGEIEDENAICEDKEQNTQGTVSPPYTDLTTELGANNHVYDEMVFENDEHNQTTSSPTGSDIILGRSLCCLFPSSCKNSKHIQSMSVCQVVTFFDKNGLHSLAEICNKEKLDGLFVSELTREELMNEPFNQTEEQVECFSQLLFQQQK